MVHLMVLVCPARVLRRLGGILPERAAGGWFVSAASLVRKGEGGGTGGWRSCSECSRAWCKVVLSVSLAGSRVFWCRGVVQVSAWSGGVVGVV